MYYEFRVKEPGTAKAAVCALLEAIYGFSVKHIPGADSGPSVDVNAYQPGCRTLGWFKIWESLLKNCPTRETRQRRAFFRLVVPELLKNLATAKPLLELLLHEPAWKSSSPKSRRTTASPTTSRRSLPMVS